MATAYSTLYGYIRTLLGDTDVSLQKWTDDVIADAISVSLLTNNTYSASGVTVVPTIASDNDTAIIVCKAALVLLSPTGSLRYWKTRNMSVGREYKAKLDVMRILEEMISEAESGGESSFLADHSLTAYLERVNRLITSINEASV